MRVDGLRRRVSERLAEVSTVGEEETIARVLDFSRALLLALASHPGDADVDVEGLEVRTGTAARILGLHPEYLRELIRKRELRASKENGEFQITLSEVVSFQQRSLRLKGRARTHTPWRVSGMLLGQDLWRRPPEQPESA